MSARTGDKSRYNRLRKQKLHRREVAAAIVTKAKKEAAIATAKPTHA